MKRSIVLILLILLFAAPVQAKHAALEKEYQAQWCSEHGGVCEHVLPDSARVDCLMEAYAVEFDFAQKWAEAVGQSLYYAAMTGKKPGIVLIIEQPGDVRYLDRLKVLAITYGITVWTMEPGELLP